MTEFFLSIFNSIDDVLGVEGVFLISTVFLTFLFVTLLIITLVKGISKKSRLSYFLMLLSVPFFEWAIENFLTNGKYFSFTLSFYCVYVGILLLIPEKSVKFTKEQKDLAKFFSDCVHREQPCEKTEEKIECERIKTTENYRQNITENELDFSHVKSVLSRMEYYNLTPNDKRQVKELENAISQGQTELTPALKEKINDGLGALLKIMSKYGI